MRRDAGLMRTLTWLLWSTSPTLTKKRLWADLSCTATGCQRQVKFKKNKYTPKLNRLDATEWCSSYDCIKVIIGAHYAVYYLIIWSELCHKVNSCYARNATMECKSSIIFLKNSVTLPGCSYSLQNLLDKAVTLEQYWYYAFSGDLFLIIWSGPSGQAVQILVSLGKSPPSLLPISDQ